MLVVGRACRHCRARQLSEHSRTSSCSSSAPLRCAAPAAPGTTSSTAISTRSVERTRSRPIPSGQVSVQASRGLPDRCRRWSASPCWSQFNRFTIALGIASLAIVAVYPFMKRITYWPQIVLGLAFSWGALMGWTAAFGRLDLPALAPLRRIDRLGHRLRHDLRASRPRGRRADRHQIDGAAVRRAHQADTERLFSPRRSC